MEVIFRKEYRVDVYGVSWLYANTQGEPKITMNSKDMIVGDNLVFKLLKDPKRESCCPTLISLSDVSNNLNPVLVRWEQCADYHQVQDGDQMLIHLTKLLGEEHVWPHLAGLKANAQLRLTMVIGSYDYVACLIYRTEEQFV